jgi:hypothetical protein
LQVEMTDEAYQRLVAAAAVQGRSVAEVVRRALNIEAYLREEAEREATVIVEERDGTRKELVF